MNKNNEQKIINYRKPKECTSSSDIPSFDQGSLLTHATLDQKKKKSYRTRSGAKGADPLPKRIPIISREPWLGAISFKKNKYAYMRQKEDSEKIPEIQSLRFLFGVFLLKFPVDAETDDLEKIPDGWLDQTVTIYLPDYTKAIGLRDNIGSDSVNAIINKISGYANLIGVVCERESGLATYKEYPVIKDFNHDRSDNTITFASPYLMWLIRKVESARIIIDKKGEPIRYENGKLKLSAAYSCQLKPEILKEKNHKAVEIAGIFATLTDRAGSPKNGKKEKVVNIRFSEVVNRNEELKVAYEKAPNDSKKDRVLERGFKKGYELLRERTDLRDSYRNIKLPDPQNKKCIPTTARINEVLRITHEGKIRRRGIDINEKGA